MLIWSVVPDEYLFEGMDKAEYNWIEAEVNGVKMLVEPTDQPGYAKIIRLLCPKPESYINPSCQPGQTVCLIKPQ